MVKFSSYEQQLVIYLVCTRVRSCSAFDRDTCGRHISTQLISTQLLICVAVCCSVLQCVAVCCSAFDRDTCGRHIYICGILVSKRPLKGHGNSMYDPFVGYFFSIRERHVCKIYMLIYVTRISQKYRVAKTHRMPYLYVIFRKRALQLVALLRKMTCNLRHPMGLRHSVWGGYD